MCWPTEKAVAKKTRDMVKQYKANSVFIATDNDPYTSVIENELKTLKKKVSSMCTCDSEISRDGVCFHIYLLLLFLQVTVHHQVERHHQDGPIIDLAILTKSKVFIGNCVSSFSAFVKRTRDVEGKASGFWSFDPKTSPKAKRKDEL